MPDNRDTSTRTYPQWVVDRLRTSKDAECVGIAALIEGFQNTPYGNAYTAQMVAVVGLAAKDPKNFTVKPDPQKFEGLFTWGKEFIGELLRSLRNIICKNNQLPRMSQYHVYPEAVFAAIAAEIMQRTGHTESMALGLATLILMILARITKEAFCKMTDDEVLKRFGILKLAVATRKLAIKRTAVAKKRAAAKKRKP